MNQHRVDLRTDEGTLDVYLFRPDGTGPWPAVLVYMGTRSGYDLSWRDVAAARLARLCRRVAESLPPHTIRPFDPKQVAVEGPERARFKSMVASINGPMVMRDTAAVLAHLDGLPSVRPSKLGALGYCMGGGYALAAAGTFPERVAVAASFHGGALATEKPDSPHLLAPKMRARVYVGAAGIDPTFPEEQRQRLTIPRWTGPA